METVYSLDDLKTLSGPTWLVRLASGGWQETGIDRNVAKWRDADREVFANLCRRLGLDREATREGLSAGGRRRFAPGSEWRYGQPSSLKRNSPVPEWALPESVRAEKRKARQETALRTGFAKIDRKSP